jgi:hypothetical protein
MNDPLKPGAGLLCKLGSLAVHVDEALSANGHDLDIQACRGILKDPEVIAWLDGMDGMALLPVKR